ncbi:T6SS phospholipase effector Tle1-like catalytic domain-containing protein [Vibrio owensii]|uniref:phospholipase effector Tle1 domain-containing protein n=1 Tax=Vibrio owensii TaxID=696485 RepID=UPI0022DDD0DE|nr:DUF2235 domain-containing protein [Vibrio owensii]MDA0384074.1 DUF2235 domain-containing protein [Vibrio owensii]
MASLYIFNFDGTSNSPDDAVQEVDFKGQIEDDSITNILKLHLLCGGSLSKQGKGWLNTQHCYYYAGVGTYGNRIQKALNTLFAPEGTDVRHILRRAIRDFDSIHFNANKDILLVTGFSRGAALARRFAKLVSDKVTRPCIYEAVYDTVASINAPNLSKRDRPESEVVFENHSLPKNVLKALHLVSLDEKRRAFQPTLMNQEDKVTEIWFAGAHADVGGGYNKDGLSDNAISYYMNWLHDLDIGIEIRKAQDVDFTSILPFDANYDISEGDIAINPNPLGFSHEQDRWLPLSLVTLCHRFCCAIENDKISTRIPLVHWSVANRIYHDQDYRPQSLKNVKHQLVYNDNERIICEGIRAHIELPQQNLTVLKKGETKLITVFASEMYNRTGLYLQSEKTYTFHVEDGEKWKDSSIECSAEGWDRANVKLGLREIPISVMEPFRRVVDANWFELCASIGCDDKEVFRIGTEVTHSPKASGEFCPFANDLKRFYGNNQGKIRCLVKRIE